MEEVATICCCGLVLTQFYITVKVEYYEHHEPWAYLRLRERVLSSNVTIFRVILLFLQAMQLIMRFHLYHLCFYVVVSTLACLFFPYLRKPSPYLPNCYHGGKRLWYDPLITTSAVYMAAGTVAWWHGEYPIAFLCAMTTMGSICYHKHREGQFFNFDNIFACTHFLIYGYSFYDSYDTNFYYFLLGVFGFPIPIYFLKQCGDPADIIYLRKPSEEDFSVYNEPSMSYSLLREKHPHPVVRYSRKTYELLHLCWHFTSGIGPFIAMLYFAHYKTPVMVDLSSFGVRDQEVLPVVGLLVSLTLNVIANYCAAAPLH